MSEYQYIEFRAVDRPLTDAELRFAEGQSTRADVTRWSFQNEYHYGSFRGDVEELLRHGYDVYLHFANFGVRTAAFRLPAGLPFPKKTWSQYIGVGGLIWKQDRNGKAGTLFISSSHDPGESNEIWAPGEYMDDLVAFRNRLVEGDLRALYVLSLCAEMDDQTFEPEAEEPLVPSGLAESVEAFERVAGFFGLDPFLLLAAAEGTPDNPNQPSDDRRCREWVEGLSAVESKKLLHRFLAENPHTVKAETVAEIQRNAQLQDWPTVSSGRTLQMLFDRAEQLRAEYDAKEKEKRAAAAKRRAAKEERQRQDRMQEMAKDPQSWLRAASQLVDQRGRENYEAAATILADLREAVGGDAGRSLTRTHAAHLAKQYPTLTRLKSSLRIRGLLG